MTKLQRGYGLEFDTTKTAVELTLTTVEPGQIVILNGVQRSGKTSIAQVIQETFPGIWMSLGADAHIRCTPPAFRPGVGLRPQKSERSRAGPGRVPVEILEQTLPAFYAGLY